MDVLINKNALLKELQYVQGVVERKTTVPILANLLLEAEGSNLVVTATDLDVTFQCTCSAQINSGGAITVPARKLFDIVRLLPDDSDVHLKEIAANSTEWMEVLCQRSRFKVSSLARESFPDVPEFDQDSINLPTKALSYMISRCIYAITQEESRYTLNGALMIVNPAGIAFVTTDGHRLVLVEHDVALEGIEEEIRVLIPKKTLVELGRLSQDSESGHVSFAHTDNHIFFKVNDRKLVSRVLTGQFPNYEMVIPKDCAHEVVVNSADFAGCLKRTSIMADEESKAVLFDIQQDQMEVTAVSSDFGEARDFIPVEFGGEPFQIGFNAQYILDFLSGLNSEKVTLRLNDQKKQGLFVPHNLENFRLQYVVMPLKN
jgi:DNA polymerase III subunit beta